METKGLFRTPLTPDLKYRRLVFDIECNGLLGELTGMHCFVAFDLGSKAWFKTTNVEEAVRILETPGTIAIGHFIEGYDIPALSKLIGRKLNIDKTIDTLPLSQYLYPNRVKHGLEGFGEDFGIKKPEVKDWENLTEEEYLHRCTEDVKINTKLYMTCISRLKNLYDNVPEDIDEIICYLTFKQNCLAEQAENPIPLDFNLLFTEMLKLTEVRDGVKSELSKQMPNIVKYAVKNRPEKYFKKDGSKSVAAEKWETLLRELGYTEQEMESLNEVTVEDSVDSPNPDSNDQLKAWLFSLGWEPCTFKHVEDKPETKRTGRKVFRKVPQISDLDDKTKLTPSVLRLAEENESVKVLAGYSTLKHRVTILEGFLRDCVDGRLVSDAGGLTNTMRLKHRVIVNLPKPHAAYAEHIRECLVAPEGYYMVGSDLTGIEDNTKQHYIFPLDPDYVNSMRTPGFDPHIKIAVLAEMITDEDSDFFKMYESLSKEDRDKLSDEEHARYKNIKKIRGDAKPVNFSATYGVGAKKLAMTGGFSVDFAQLLLDTYWGLNWAVKEFAEQREVKVVDGQKWVRQPVSGFWYSLRADKDKFSTVNQSTAVYVFDLWLKYVREEGIQVSMQYHDEIMFFVKNDIPEQEVIDKINKAMARVNEALKLNIEVKCSLDFGQNYKEVH